MCREVSRGGQDEALRTYKLGGREVALSYTGTYVEYDKPLLGNSEDLATSGKGRQLSGKAFRFDAQFEQKSSR